MQKYTSERPDDSYGHAILGASFQGAGRRDEAVREFERGLAIDPDYRYIQINLAELYVYQGKPEKAIPFFKQNIQEISDDAEAMYDYGNALTQTGDLAGAENVVRKSIALDGKSIDAHKLLVIVLQGEGKIQEAGKEQRIVGLLQASDPGASTDTKTH
jgi:predicted Zn-dependent protease